MGQKTTILAQLVDSGTAMESPGVWCKLWAWHSYYSEPDKLIKMWEDLLCPKKDKPHINNSIQKSWL